MPLARGKLYNESMMHHFTLSTTHPLCDWGNCYNLLVKYCIFIWRGKDRKNGEQKNIVKTLDCKIEAETCRLWSCWRMWSGGKNARECKSRGCCPLARTHPWPWGDFELSTAKKDTTPLLHPHLFFPRNPKVKFRPLINHFSDLSLFCVSVVSLICKSYLSLFTPGNS